MLPKIDISMFIFIDVKLSYVLQNQDLCLDHL